jgi:probable HAF family extracellular repeat protein
MFSFGKAINISGQVAGMVTTGSGNSERVFRYTEGVGMVQLGGVGETNEVWAMNARGDFVGRGQPTAGLERAFIYTDQGGLTDFSALIDPALNLRVMYAHDINDAGQIAALAYDYVLGLWRAVRLDPTVPVGPIAALSTTSVKIESGSACTGWVTLTAPAPAGGAQVMLSATDAALVSVPGSVTVAAGSRQQSFSVAATAGKTGVTQLSAVYNGGTRSASLTVTAPAATAVRGSVPPLRVHAIIPNPASTSARIEFELASAAGVRVDIYDVAGRLVRALSNSTRIAGPHVVVWNGTDQRGLDVPSGAYFVRFQAGAYTHSEKVVLVR